ncbi:MAG: anthranilate phosphoribosyltransferase [bacterium]|jgi:anthranilate phosphoribosyltransferase
MIRKAIRDITEGRHLSESDAELVMTEIMAGEATPAQIGSLLTGLRLRGETVKEVTGFVRAMRRCAVPFFTSRSVIDTCGTGGDMSGTFNVSTVAAFVAAGAGLAVAKHGNRSVSSQCGSADVLEAMGVDIALLPERASVCLEQTGFAFLFAQRYHPAMKHAAAPRRELGIRTVFNIMGPLANPAGAVAQVVGVYAPELTEFAASILANLGTERALVVHGEPRLDEISICGSTRVTELGGGKIRTYMVTPEDFGLKRLKPKDIRGGDAAVNAAIALSVLAGEAGPARDLALLNAGAALYVGGAAGDLREGVKLAAEVIDRGLAMACLKKVRRVSNELP